MLLDVLFISLTGILVVFGFLILMFFILSSFKFLNKEKKEENKSSKTQVSKSNKKYQNRNIEIKGEVSEEVIAVIISSLNHHNKNINGKEISIKKRR